jgi:hypothetical protein
MHALVKCSRMVGWNSGGAASSIGEHIDPFFYRQRQETPRSGFGLHAVVYVHRGQDDRDSRPCRSTIDTPRTDTRQPVDCASVGPPNKPTPKFTILFF